MIGISGRQCRARRLRRKEKGKRKKYADVFTFTFLLLPFSLLRSRRHPFFKFEFSNGTVIHFRPAGAFGVSFRSLHVDRLWVDEGAWIPEKAWKSLRQCVNANGKIRIYSTPNGLRNSTYYRLTHTRGWEVFRWPSWKNPNWDDNRERELEDFYGGRDTAGWQHAAFGVKDKGKVISNKQGIKLINK